MGDTEGLEHGVLLVLICKSPVGDFPGLGHPVPHCCESLGHLPAPLASGPITFLSVMVTQPFGSVGSKLGGVERVRLVPVVGVGDGSNLPFCADP